ncbi:hypothetical protein C8A05DRAFT_37960 [Staphylotrichum tortipilum]|uniref:CENP-V/GFA domain-containing protein n=1 Tax=Staphylotrichum tortipilum TaxID=2831512 RepID=A0AAN6MCU9_9PEZI|nr:hypothetical protein C8A05DRAFT_37960 [Staphylotrichum longicolle]
MADTTSSSTTTEPKATEEAAPAPPPGPVKTYRGNCHCGAFVFEVDAPEITKGSDCNCSICTKRAYLWLVPEKPIVVVRDEGKLVGYRFASKNMDHKFCSVCGTTVMATSEMFAAKMGINVRTLQNLDLWSLKLSTFDGKSWDPQYEAPAFSGPEPNPPGLEDGKTYHGSCHCGAVTTAVRVNGSLEDGTYVGPIIECNCSSCARGGYARIYPNASQLTIHGRESLSYYTFGHHVWRHSFCKTCGVYVATDQNELSDEEVAALPEAIRAFRVDKADKRPFNLRVLNGFDVKSVKAMQVDGWTRQMPGYVNP